MDFSNAQLPSLLPLAASFSENEVEDDLKRLFLDLFNARLSADAFDANVLGVAHLGSLDLVRRAINMDGLVLLPGDREEAATRYLYRAWKSGDVQGRGVHFLRTYLQLLFPGLCEVEQLWQDKAQPYPTALYTGNPRVNFWLYALGEPGLKLNAGWKVGGQRAAQDFDAAATRIPDMSGMFLTSRIDIALDFSVQVQSVASLMHIIRSVIPARLLPIFRFMLRFVLTAQAKLSSQLVLQKNARVRYPWNGRVISDMDDARWSLGLNGSSGLKLSNLRVSSSASMESKAEAATWRIETLPADSPPEFFTPPAPTKLCATPRRLAGLGSPGAWQLGAENKVRDLLPFKLDGRRLKARKTSSYPRIGQFKIRNISPPILLPPPQSRLTLSGRWKMGCARQPGFEINVFKV